ncbi:hypothetical protein CDAR_235501 [Caerostris darwini]|uniref:Anaphase-promoting complex subunit 4-like WD40 domain-containing protein n=1 Tax=Caerostris darwini TaxID=1538125 RepID=A0AAV4NA38_9ARAC|nr:hypothetical protein CDAR_235501 [Caerostris darwini]
MRVYKVKFFDPKPQAIRCLAFDKSTFQLAVSRTDSSIEIWDAKENPFLEKVIPGTCKISVETLTWSNGRLFSAGQYGYLTEYNLQTLVPKKQISVTSTCPIWCMKFNSKGKCLAVGNEDGHVVLHQLTSEGLNYIKKFNRQEGCILCLDWHKDEEVIVTGSIDSIRTWNVKTGCVINRILLARAAKTIPTIVWCISITSDMTIISGDSRGKVSFWDGNMGTMLQELASNAKEKHDILSLVMNENEDVMYVSGVDSTITSYMKSQSNNKWLRSIERNVHTHDVRALQIVGEYLVSGGDDCNLVFTKYPPKTTIKYYPFCQKPYCKVSSSTSCILLTYPDYIEIWTFGPNPSDNDYTPANLLRVKPKKTERVISSSISSNGLWLSYSTQSKIRLYRRKIDGCIKDTSTLRNVVVPSLNKIVLPNEIPCSTTILLFNSESTKLILYAQNKIFIVKCDIMQSTLESTIETDANDEVRLMEISNNSDYLACGYKSGNVVILNLNTLKIHSKLPLYKCQATALKFDPSSENLIAVYSDRKIVEYSLKAEAYSDWSKQRMLLNFQTAAPHAITSVCFFPGFLFLQDETNIYIFNRNEELPPGNKKKKVNDGSSMVLCESGEFKTINYEHISSIHSHLEELVVVQISSDRILDFLPPPVWKKKFGT